VEATFEKADLIDFAVERAVMTGLPLGRQGGSVAAFDNLYLPRLHRAGAVAPDVGSSQATASSPGGYVMDQQCGMPKPLVASPGRLELPTSGFASRRSLLLIYGDKKNDRADCRIRTDGEIAYKATAMNRYAKSAAMVRRVGFEPARAVRPTSLSSWRVDQFHHLRIELVPGEGFEPSGTCV
jgi:hypothetical protein